jgi:hypothetical protein
MVKRGRAQGGNAFSFGIPKRRELPCEATYAKKTTDVSQEWVIAFLARRLL